MPQFSLVFPAVEIKIQKIRRFMLSPVSSQVTDTCV